MTYLPCFPFHIMIVEFIVVLIDEVNKVDDYIYFRIIKHFSGMECYLYAQPLNLNTEQDRPSLESSSYLNVTLRFLGPWDPWTLGLLDLLPPPFSSSYSPPLAWFGMVLVLFGMGGVSCDL